MIIHGEDTRERPTTTVLLGVFVHEMSTHHHYSRLSLL